jgi:hypothetical protein
MRAQRGFATALVSLCLASLPAAQRADDGPAKLARTVAALNDEVNREVTVAQWRRAHPKSSVTATPFNEWCVAATEHVELTAGSPIEITARFYHPPVPATLDLPAASSRLTESCRLLRFQIVRRPSTSGAHNSVTQVIGAMTARLGAPVSPGADWVGQRPAGVWTSRGTTTSLVQFGDQLTLTAVKDGSGVTGGGEGIAEYLKVWRIANNQRRHRFDEVIGLANAGNVAIEHIRERWAAWDHEKPTPSDEGDLVAALDALLGQKPDAARLLAAELLFASAEGAGVGNITQGTRSATALRKRLEGLGLRFRYAELGRAYLSDHRLLTSAAAMRSSTRIDELVFLTQMELGFETHFACRDQRGAGFRAVILRGEKFLADHPANGISAAIYRNLAMAYGDAIAVEGNLPELFVAAEARDARPRAIRAFREAVDIEGVTPQNAALWPNMWRLRAGLAPAQTHFVCHYD